MNAPVKSLGRALFVLSLGVWGMGASLAGGDDTVPALVNQTAGLAGYPGAADVRVQGDGLDTRTSFRADATLAEVYAYFDGELSAQGWVRTGLKEGDSETEANYRREGRTLEFKLERGGGGFRLEIDLGGDNAGYDEDDGTDIGTDDNGTDDGSTDNNGTDDDGDDGGSDG